MAILVVVDVRITDAARFKECWYRQRCRRTAENVRRGAVEPGGIRSGSS